MKFFKLFLISVCFLSPCFSQEDRASNKINIIHDKFYQEFNQKFFSKYSKIKNNSDVELLVRSNGRLARYVIKGAKAEAIIRREGVEIRQLIESEIVQKIYDEVTTGKGFFNVIPVADQKLYDEMSGGIQLLFVWNNKKICLISPFYMFAISKQDKLFKLERDISPNLNACFHLAKIDTEMFLEYSDVSMVPLNINMNFDSFIKNGFKDFTTFKGK